MILLPSSIYMLHVTGVFAWAPAGLVVANRNQCLKHF